MALSLAGGYTEVPLKDVVLLIMGTKVNGQHSYYGSLKLNSLNQLIQISILISTSKVKLWDSHTLQL